MRVKSGVAGSPRLSHNWGTRTGRLPRKRIGPKLESNHFWPRSLAAFRVEWCPVAIRAPQPAPLPAGIGIVDPAVEALGEEAHGVRHAQLDELAIHEHVQRIGVVAGRDRHVLAEAERVVLVHERIVARLGTAGFRLAYAVKLRSWQAIEGPRFGTMLAGRSRPIERALAFPAVEARHVPARERHPDDALGIDVKAARRVARERHFVDLRQRVARVITRIKPHHHAGEA